MSETLEQPRPVAPADPAAAATVFYDGACPLCRREIAQYRAMSGAEGIAWVDIAAEEPPTGWNRDELLGRFTALRGDGRVARGAAGFAALWRGLGPLRWLGRLADRQPFLLVGEGLYRLFLRLRPLWRRAG